ncbi:MAG: hypothetical protein HOM96_05635, partial [Rickettsiales bacterium]|nr:hypothetical protein [Rickettsiales bacterium]
AAAQEFSYQYQQIAKDSGFYTDREENFKPVGARLKRIPAELTGDIMDEIANPVRGSSR